MMSAVKPMRLSFKHIQDPGDASTSAGNSSPFKKRLNDIFTTGGANKFYAFEDIIMTSPAKPMSQELFSGLEIGSPVRRNGYGAVIRDDKPAFQIRPELQESEDDYEYEQEDDEGEEEEPPLRLNLFGNYP
jgi:hypothetical protein